MRLSPSSPCSSMRSISDNQMIQKSLPVYDREGYFDLGGSAFMIRVYSVSEKDIPEGWECPVKKSIDMI